MKTTESQMLEALQQVLHELTKRASLVDQVKETVVQINLNQDKLIEHQKRLDMERVQSERTLTQRQITETASQHMMVALENEFPQFSGMRGLIRRVVRPVSSKRLLLILSRARKIAMSPIFDANWYSQKNPDIREAEISPLLHYITNGGSEGRAPSLLFDPAWYLKSCEADLKGEITPLEHYLSTPLHKRVSPHPLFDSQWYLDRNPDVFKLGVDPLEHFINSGANEGRDPHPEFSCKRYLKRYKDVAREAVNPLAHYLEFGIKEGRKYSPSISVTKRVQPHRKNKEPRKLQSPGQVVVGRATESSFEAKSQASRKNAVSKTKVMTKRADAISMSTQTALNDVLNSFTMCTVFGRKLDSIFNEICGDELVAAIRKSEEALKNVEAQLSKHSVRPLVSVIMPTFNRAAIISEAIESVLGQDYEKLELFVCDDASSDDTEQVVTRIRDPRVRYIKLVKGGAARARNAGLEQAKGDFIAYLDSDNYWHPTFLSRMVLELLDWPGHSTAYASFIDFEIRKDAKTRLRSFRRPNFDHEQLLEKNFIDLNSFMHHRELYECFGGFNEQLTRRQDYDLIIKFTWLRDPRKVEEILTLYQRNDSLQQITKTRKHDMSCVPIINERIAKYFDEGLPVTGPRHLRKVTILSWDLCRNHFSKPFALAEALSRDYEVQLVSFRFFEEPIFPPLEGVEPPFETIYLPGGEFPGFFKSMKQAIDAIDGEVIYVVKPRLPSLGLALLINQVKGTPVILEINDLETVVSSPKEEDRHAETPLDQMRGAHKELISPYSDLWSRLMDPVAKSVPTLVTHNKNIDEHFGGRCLYMRNLKDEAVHDPDQYDRDAVRSDLGFQSDDRVILFGGLLRKHKGIFELVELVERLDDPRYKLLFVGSRTTPDQKRLLDQFGDQVRVLPPQGREEMAQINYAADLVILWLNPEVAASHYQMPYKATDAFAMGPTIIANDISDLGPLARQGYLRIVPFGDWNRMTEVIRDVFENSEHTTTIRECARRLYLRQFSYAAARSNFELAARRAFRVAKSPLPVAIEFTKSFNAFYRSVSGSKTDFVEIDESMPTISQMIKGPPGHGEMDEDASIIILDVQTLEGLSFTDIEGIAVIMPSIKTEKALDTARLLVRRAGMPATIFIIEDTLRQGFIRTLNATAQRINVKYVVYLAEDSFPGVDWLRLAFSELEETGKGLLAFNCGKWRGRIAAFGMVRMTWVKELYGGPVLYPEYKSHRADNEITAIARANDEFIYCPDAVLVENDPGKAFRKGEAEASNFHVADKKLFIARFNTEFDGLAPLDNLELIRDEYLNQRKLRAK